MMQDIYIDTSVIGGCLDAEFQEWSVRLFDEFKKGIKRCVISSVVLSELEDAPQNVKNVLAEVPSGNKILLNRIMKRKNSLKNTLLQRQLQLNIIMMPCILPLQR